MKLFRRFLAFTLALVFTMLFGTYETFAVGGAGIGNVPSGGGGSGTHIGSQAGGGWFWYPWPEGNTTGVVIGGQGNYKGGTISPECAAVGGYYVSQWYWFHGDNFTDYRGKLGIAENSIFNDNWSGTGGGTKYGNNSLPASEQPVPIGTVYEHFNTAKAAGVVGEGVTDANVGWFCYSDDLKEKVGNIHGTSTISASASGISYDAQTSNTDGYIWMKISADWNDTVIINFSHNLTFTPAKNASGETYTFNGEGFDEKYRYYGTDDDGSGSNKQHFSNPNYRGKVWSGNTGDGSSTTVETTTVTVSNPKVGNDSMKSYTTGWICRQVGDYASVLTFKGNSAPDYTEPKDTKACMKITFVKDPDGGPKDSKGNVAGSAETGTMFIGESASIGWSSSARGVATRRLKAYRAIRYLVDPGSHNTKTSVAGLDRSSDGPKDYIKGLGSINVRNVDIAQAAKNNGDKYDLEKVWDNPGTSTVDVSGDSLYGVTTEVVVPEVYHGSTSSIGAKYCNTAGYKFQYWYAVNKVNTASSNDDWNHVSGEDYWYIFDSACSVIAKRPSMAIWNGSVFADGGVNTSLSKRYNTTTMGTLKKESDVEIGNTYGSWGEYLLIGGRSTITNMASGAALADGGSGSQSVESGGLDHNSNMTIQNVTELGKSGINPNGTYRSRLNAQLRDADGVAEEITDSDASKLTLNVLPDDNGTVRGSIYNVKGNLEINSDIKNTGVYKPGSIPQMVIFVDGNLTITANVRQIDAWLIVSKELRTCKELTDSDSCSNQLVFNGPVSAGSIKLQRTHGAEKRDEASTPAEIFNFRPDAYIWAYNQSVKPNEDGGFEFRTVDAKELAPRY